MKQKIYFLGLATTLITLLGVMFKVNHFPGAGIMMAFGIISFILVFLPIALKNLYGTEGNRQNWFLYFITWLTCFIVFTGMLFKIMHWPGAGLIMTLALPFPFVVFLPIFLIVTSRDKNFNIYNTVYVLFLLSVVSVLSALLALDVSKNRIDDSLLISESYNKLENFLDETISDNAQSPVVREIDEILIIVDDYQDKILKNEGITEEQWNKDPWILPNKTKRAVLGTGKKSIVDTRLETSLKDLISKLKVTPGCEELSESAPVIFDFREIPEGNYEWTNRIFRENTLSWILIYLDGLETNLKLMRY
jgi:hypothetical protein